MNKAPISHHFFEVLSPPQRTRGGRERPGTGRAQEYMDLLNTDGTVFQTIKLGSPAPLDTVREAVERANRHNHPDA